MLSLVSVLLGAYMKGRGMPGCQITEACYRIVAPHCHKGQLLFEILTMIVRFASVCSTIKLSKIGVKSITNVRYWKQ